MGNKQLQWRKMECDSFVKTEQYLRNKITTDFKNVKLNLCLVGHTGAGKSSFINSVFSISRGRIVDFTTVKTDDIEGVGTIKMLEFKGTSQDLFCHVKVYDTMGFTQTNSDIGISDEDLKAVFEGEIEANHEFNSSKHAGNQNKQENKPHCVIIVASAELVQNMTVDDDSVLTVKMRKLHSLLPGDVSKIVVLTKCDKISDSVYKDIANIYSCKTIESVVQKATRIFGTPQYMVFPIVNYYKEAELNPKQNVPILHALMFALNFASDREELRR